MKGDHDDGDNRDNYGDGEGEGDCVVDADACAVQLQQGDAEMRQLQSGSREVAFTKQLRCQLKVSWWGVSFSL